MEGNLSFSRSNGAYDSNRVIDHPAGNKIFGLPWSLHFLLVTALIVIEFIAVKSDVHYIIKTKKAELPT